MHPEFSVSAAKCPFGAPLLATTLCCAISKKRWSFLNSGKFVGTLWKCVLSDMSGLGTKDSDNPGSKECGWIGCTRWRGIKGPSGGTQSSFLMVDSDLRVCKSSLFWRTWVIDYIDLFSPAGVWWGEGLPPGRYGPHQWAGSSWCHSVTFWSCWCSHNDDAQDSTGGQVNLGALFQHLKIFS